MKVASSVLSEAQAGLPTIAPKVSVRGSDSDGRTSEIVVKSPFSFDATFDSKTPDERADLLAKVLATDTNAELRRTAAWGLAKYIENPVASSALTRALLHDASASVRETAAWALARDHRNAPQPAVAALTSALRSDASDSVRATAAWALGSIHDDAAIPALTAALADRNADVRSRAVWALGSVRPHGFFLFKRFSGYTIAAAWQILSAWKLSSCLMTAGPVREDFSRHS